MGTNPFLFYLGLSAVGKGPAVVQAFRSTPPQGLHTWLQRGTCSNPAAHEPLDRWRRAVNFSNLPIH